MFVFSIFDTTINIVIHIIVAAKMSVVNFELYQLSGNYRFYHTSFMNGISLFELIGMLIDAIEKHIQHNFSLIAGIFFYHTILSIYVFFLLFIFFFFLFEFFTLFFLSRLAFFLLSRIQINFVAI